MRGSCAIMAALGMAKGSIRLRKMFDGSFEYVIPCHNETITAISLADGGEFLATTCENGNYIRVFGWFENLQKQQMEPPISLYIIETGLPAGQITQLNFSNTMNFITASVTVEDRK